VNHLGGFVQLPLKNNVSMTPDIVKKLYREFHSGPVQGTDSAEASSHWKDFSKYSKVEADADGNIITIKGFGFGGSDDSRLAAKIVAATGNKLMMAGLSYPGLEKDVKKSQQLVGSMGLYFSQDAFRQACTKFFLAKKIAEQKMPVKNILIIGDGFGVLAALMSEQYPGANIFLIDLGVTLFFQSYYLSKKFPGKSHTLLENGVTVKEGSGFYYCPAEHVQHFPEVELDLAINIASMQEMNPEMIRTYFNLLRERKTKLFYCCNRLEKILPDGTPARIFEFPWEAEDVFLVDEVCPWHKFFVGRIGGKSVKLLDFIPIPLLRKYDGVHWHRLALLAH
jgi:hypothetical protein